MVLTQYCKSTILQLKIKPPRTCLRDICKLRFLVGVAEKGEEEEPSGPWPQTQGEFVSQAQFFMGSQEVAGVYAGIVSTCGNQ